MRNVTSLLATLADKTKWPFGSVTLLALSVATTVKGSTSPPGGLPAVAHVSCPSTDVKGWAWSGSHARQRNQTGQTTCTHGPNNSGHRARMAESPSPVHAYVTPKWLLVQSRPGFAWP